MEKSTRLLLGVTICYTFILTLKPFEFSSLYLHEYLRFDSGIVRTLFGRFRPADILANILFFMPFGFLGGILFKFTGLRKTSILKKTFILGISLSLFLEFGQLFLRRTTSLTDVINNGLGAMFGALLSSGINLKEIPWYLQFIRPKDGAFLTKTLLVYIFLLMFFLISPTWLLSPLNWDRDYYLLVGNEGTMNRPWQGTLYELAIYSTMLPAEKITKNFMTGRVDPLDKSLIAHYKFNECTGKIVHDLSRYQPALDLVIADTTQVRWDSDENGLKLFKGSLLKSTEPGTKLVDAIKSTQQLSVEIWIKPANLQQTGPARIVSLSKNPHQRNFMVGQAQGSLNLRVRTPLAGPNGSRVEIFTHNPCLSPKRQHVVAVFNHGAAQIYLNGELLPDKIAGFSDYVPFLSGFGTKFVGKITFCFMILFPLGWLIHLKKQSLFWKLFFTPMAVFAPVIIAQIVLHLLSGHPFDGGFIMASAITGLFFVILGMLR